jgi:hypothetical protein
MLKVSVDLSRDNDAKKLAIWPSAFGQKRMFASDRYRPKADSQ